MIFFFYALVGTHFFIGFFSKKRKSPMDAGHQSVCRGVFCALSVRCSHEQYSHKNSIVEFKTKVRDHCSTRYVIQDTQHVIREM